MRFLFSAFFFFFVFSQGVASAQKLSPLAPQPDWKSLEVYQGTISREEFVDLLERVYAPGGAAAKWVRVGSDSASIVTTEGKAPWVLRFSGGGGEVPARKWRGRREMPPAVAGKPLEGVRIAIDPGHIGGQWAKMEERWFQFEGGRPVIEGDMTLYVAKLIKSKLEKLGAIVELTRGTGEPVTSQRPQDLQKAAKLFLIGKKEAVTAEKIRKESETLFYRASEIRARAKRIEKFRPDLVLCLHFNAESWGDENHPKLVKENHLHFLVSGSFGKDELEYEDQRYGMLSKLLGRVHGEELAVSKEVAKAMAEGTGLPPYEYKGGKAVDVGGGSYIWARNLLANRVFDCPVVFAEPYVMNNREVYARVQARDYKGKKTVFGRKVPSLYQEYADGVVAGLVAYYSRR